MHPPDDLTAALPAPRDDEPAALRGDIVDEITDHLTCATRREQFRTGIDETEARRRAIHRFGDPARICVQLWWARMRGTIMTQRSLIGMFVATIAAFVVGTFVMWQFHREQVDMILKYQNSASSQMREQRGIFERLLGPSQAASAELAKQAEANAQEVRELRKLIGENKAPSEWTSMEIRFVPGAENGPPARDVSVGMHSVVANRMPPMNAKSDADGLVRFPQVLYGQYLAHFTTPSGEVLIGSERGQSDSQHPLNVLPGIPFTRTIVCPALPPEQQQVMIQAQWPADLKDKPILICIDEASLRRKAQESEWRAATHLIADNEEDSILLSPDGAMFSIRTRELQGGGYGPGVLWPRSPEMRFTPWPVDFEKAEHPEGLNWPDKSAYVGTFSVLIKLPETAEALKQEIGRFRGREVALSIQVPGGDWDYQFEAGSPGTLRLVPDDKSLNQIRQGLASIELASDRLAKAETKN